MLKDSKKKYRRNVRSNWIDKLKKQYRIKIIDKIKFVNKIKR